MSPYPRPIIHPPRCALPVLLSVPHSGRDYDPSILANAAQGRRSLEILEDPLVDRLAWRAIAAGVGAIVQPVPRAIIDCNRGEDEVDPAAIAGIAPAPVGPRARHGLGLVPSRTHRHGSLWRRPIDRVELKRRIAEVHRPYHEALAEALDALTLRHGTALLIDCHSMPSRQSHGADIVIGDRHGASASGWVTAEAARITRSAGFRVALNDPYAGGAIVERHGRAAGDIQAIQLEIGRNLYLCADGRSPNTAFDELACLIERLSYELGGQLLDRHIPIAAE